MTVILTDENDQLISTLQPQDNRDGTFTLQLPGNASLLNSLISQAKRLTSSMLQSSYCQETQRAVLWCSSLISALSQILPPGNEFQLDCPQTTSPAGPFCSTGNTVNSYLNRHSRVHRSR